MGELTRLLDDDRIEIIATSPQSKPIVFSLEDINELIEKISQCVDEDTMTSFTKYDGRIVEIYPSEEKPETIIIDVLGEKGKPRARALLHKDDIDQLISELSEIVQPRPSSESDAGPLIGALCCLILLALLLFGSKG